MNKDKLFVIVDEENWQAKLQDAEKIAEEVFVMAIDYLRQNNCLEEIGVNNKNILINLDLSNNEKVHKLNKEFRNMDKPTNVLSFANIDDENFEEEIKLGDDVEMGDIIVALETLQAEAEIKKISLKDHFSHLLVHGILHLMGYDHQDDEEAEEMEGLEIKILAKLNINNPYEQEI